MENEGEGIAGQNVPLKSLTNAIVPNHALLVKLHENERTPCKLYWREYLQNDMIDVGECHA
jgi:hypothetical protein